MFAPCRALRPCLAAAGLLLLACAPKRASDRSQTVAQALIGAPVIGAESRIDEPVFTEQSGEQSQPFIAAGGPGALVVWLDDSHPGLAASNHPPSFVRLDASGNLLDPLPIAITPPTPSSKSFRPFDPIAAWNGDVALVVWGKPVEGGQEVQGSRVTSAGVVLDPGTPDLPGGIDIALGMEQRIPVAVVPFGSDFLVFWAPLLTTARVARVGRDGSVANPGGNVIGFPADGIQRFVSGAVPVTGGALLMVGEGDSFKLMKVDATGAPLSPLSEPAGPALNRRAGIASRGDEAILCWGQTTADGQPITIYGRRATADATWIDAAPFEVRAAGAAPGQIGAVWDGSRYVCYWTDAGTRVRATFRSIAASGTPVSAAAVGPTALATAPVQAVQVASIGGRLVASMARTVYATVGQGLGDRADGVLVRGLGADLQPIGADATVVSRQPNQQTSFRAVGTPAAAFVAWQDDRQRGNVDEEDDENWDTYAARVTVGAGGDLGKAVTPLLVGATSELYPAVGWDGTQFTVAYASVATGYADKRYLQHVSASGAPAGGPIAIAETHVGTQTLVVWNGQNFLVASLYNTNLVLVMYRISAAGVLLDTTAKTVAVARPTMTSSGIFSNLQGAAIGGTYVLVFQAVYNTAGLYVDDKDVQALVVNADGTLPTTTPTMIATGAGAQDVPAIATDGTSAVLVWRDRGPAGPRIVSARVDASLTRLDAADAVIAQGAAPLTMGAPAIAWTGSAYAAVWTEAVPGNEPVGFWGCTLGADLTCAPGSQVNVPGAPGTSSPDGTVPVFVGASDDVRGPVLAWTDAGGVLFYRRLDTAPYVNRERLFTRSILIAPGRADGGSDEVWPPPDGGAGTGGSAGTGGASGTGGGAMGGAAAGGTGGAGAGGTGATDAAAGTSGGAGDTSGAAGASGGAGNTPDAGKAMSASKSGCGCALGAGDRSPAPLSLLLVVLALRRRVSRASRAAKIDRHGQHEKIPT